MRAAGDPILLASSGVFVRCTAEALRSLRQPGGLLLLVPLVAAQFIGLALLGAFPRGPGVNLLIPLLQAAGGEAALHYPEAFAILPRAFAWVSLALEYLVGTVCLAALVALLPALFQGKDPDVSRAVRVGLGRAPAAWFVVLPGLLAAAGGPLLAESLAARTGPGLAAQGIVLGVLASSTLLQVLLAYGLVAVVLGGLDPVSAIGRSFSVAGRNLLPTAGFVLGAGALSWPTRAFLGDPRRWFGVVPPELTVAVVAIEIALTALATYLLAAACARLYLHADGAGARP